MRLRRMAKWLIMMSLIISLIPAYGSSISAANAFYDFSANSNGWSPVDGAWSVNSGNYVVNAGPGYKSMMSGSNYNSFTYEADVNVGPGGNAGLIFRASAPGTGADTYKGYYAGLDVQNGRVILGKANNDWTQIMAYPYTVNANAWYHLKVVTKGKSIEVYVGSDHVISAFDDQFLSGSVGLRTFNSAAKYDNVSVTDQGVITSPTYNWSWIKGAVYVPTNAVNMIDMWQQFDTATIDRELNYAQTYGINTLGVYLHYLLWEQDPTGFLNKFESFLQIANKYGLKVEPIFFDDCWDANPHLGDQGAPIPGVHNSRWVQSPGDNVKINYFNTYKPKVKQYVQAIVNAHVNDNRIAFWEPYNEPGCNTSHLDETRYLMNDSRIWIKDTGTQIPLGTPSVQIYDGAWFSDFYSYHPYGSDYGGPKGPTVLNSESMNRGSQTVPGIVSNYGGTSTGYIMWEFGIGRTNTRFPWGSANNAPEPTTPFHGIVYPDGHPWSVDDVAALNGSTSNMPVFQVDYYNGDFTTLKKSSITPLIDFDLNTERGTASPDASAGVNETNYSIRWNGSIKPTSTGTYTFYADSDNVARLWVGNTQVVNKTTSGRATSSGTINLNANQVYAVKIEYVHGSGSSNMHVQWAGPNLTRQRLTVVPSAFTAASNSFEASNIAGGYIRHFNSRGRIDTNVTPVQDSQWRMVPGLADPTAVSFESINFPGQYLRHRNGEVWKDQNDGTAGFKADATWKVRVGLANSSMVSFESYNFPGNFMRHRDFLLYSEPITPASSSTDKSDATFKVY